MDRWWIMLCSVVFTYLAFGALEATEGTTEDSFIPRRIWNGTLEITETTDASIRRSNDSVIHRTSLYNDVMALLRGEWLTGRLLSLPTWARGVNACVNETELANELETEDGAHVYARLQVCDEADDAYICEFIIFNETHKIQKTSKWFCCDGFELDADREDCVKENRPSLEEILEDFAVEDIKDHMDGNTSQTLFIFKGMSAASVPDFRSYVVNEPVLLRKTETRYVLQTVNNKTIIVEGYEHLGKPLKLANCKGIVKANIITDGGITVHVLDGPMHFPSMTTTDYIKSRSDLSLVGRLIEKEPSLGRLFDNTYLTLFLPTDAAIEKIIGNYSSLEHASRIIILETMLRGVVTDTLACSAMVSKKAEDLQSASGDVFRFGLETYEEPGNELKYDQCRVAEADLLTTNAVIHIVDDLKDILSGLMPIERVLERKNHTSFLKAYQAIKDSIPLNSTLLVILPPSHLLSDTITTEELGRYLYVGSVPLTDFLNNTQANASDYSVHVHFHMNLFRPMITFNCIPTDSDYTMFSNGMIIPISRTITQSYPDLMTGVKSRSDKYSIFASILENYRSLDLTTGCTLLAPTNQALFNASTEQLSPGLFKFVHGATSLDTVDQDEIEHFVESLILKQEVCFGAYSWNCPAGCPNAIGAHYDVKLQKNRPHDITDGVVRNDLRVIETIGGSQVVDQDIVTDHGIIQGVDSLPEFKLAPIWSWPLFQGV